MNTQLVFPLDICPLRFTACAAIGHWSSGCHNNAQDFSGKAPIIPSGGFSVEILTGVTLSWKTKLNKSISAVEDRIPKWLQHHLKMCCEKSGHRGR